MNFFRLRKKILGLLAKLAGINQQNDFFGVFNQPFLKCGLLLKAFAGASLEVEADAGEEADIDVVVPEGVDAVPPNIGLGLTLVAPTSGDQLYLVVVGEVL